MTNENLSRENQLKAAEGNAEMDLRKTTASGLGAVEAFGKKGVGDDFSYQTQTDSQAGIEATAAKGKFSKDNKDYSRDKQVDSAKVMANDSLVKSVETANGLVDSMAFNADGSKGDAEFDKYALGTKIGSRIQANKTMGVGVWGKDKSEEAMLAAMSDIQRVGAMGVASEVAKGDAFQKGIYKGDLDKFTEDTKTGEQEKMTSSAIHAGKMRKKYGDELETAAGLYSDEEKPQIKQNGKNASQKIANAEKSKKDSEKELEDLGKNWTGSKEDMAKAKALSNNIDTANATINDKELSRNIDKAKHVDDKMTFAQAISAIDQSKIDSQLGQAMGISKNKDVNYAENSMYGEMSKQQSTKAKLDAQGGVNNAVAADVAEASLKAVKQQASAISETEQLLKKANPEMSESDAKKMAEGIVNGSIKGAEQFKNALAQAGVVASAMTGGKVAGDIKTLDILGEDGIIESAKRDSIQKNTPKKTMMDLVDDPNKTQNMLNSYIEKATDKDLARKQAIDFGLAKDVNGKLKATTGEEWIAGKAALGAASMEKDERFMFGGTRMNATTDVSSGNTLVDANSGTTKTIGDKTVVNATDAKTLNAIEAAKSNGVKVEDVVQQKNQNEANASPVDRANSTLAAKQVKEKKEFAKAVNPEDNDGSTPNSLLTDFASDAINLGSDGLLGLSAAYGVDKASKYVAKSKIPMTKEDLTSKGFQIDDDGVITDKNGKSVEERKGKFYNDNGDLLEKDNPKKKAGVIERGLNATTKKFDELVGGKPSSKTFNSSPQGSTNHQNTNNNNPVTGSNPNEFQHNNTSSEYKDSITKNSEKTKFSEPELTKSGTVLDNKPDSKGFFSKRFDAVKDVFHGGGSWKTKLGMAMGAMVLGESSAFAGNLMQAADLSSFITGTDTSPMADIDYAMKHGGAQSIYPQPQGGFNPNLQPYNSESISSNMSAPTATAIMTPQFNPTSAGANMATMPQLDASVMASQAVGNFDSVQMLAQSITAQGPQICVSYPYNTQFTNKLPILGILNHYIFLKQYK